MKTNNTVVAVAFACLSVLHAAAAPEFISLQPPPAWAEAKSDVGLVADDMPLTNLTLVLRRPEERERAFDEFLRQQQDPASPNFHRWITSTEVGEWFGVAPAEIEAVTSWLAAQGLRVDAVSTSRVRVRFSGTAAKVAAAFGTPLRKYAIDGEQRIAPANAARVPAVLGTIVEAVHGLYTAKEGALARIGPVGFEAPAGEKYSNCLTTPCKYYVYPSDFAAIYNVGPIYQQGIDGAGQNIAILGRSRIHAPDFTNFRARTNLPMKDLITIVPPNGVEPGTPVGAEGDANKDQQEATLDVLRAGSVAPGAQVKLIVSLSTPTAGGVSIAAGYAVDAIPLPAQVWSISYTTCEQQVSAATSSLWESIYKQAAAQGISVFVASGDSGAAGCVTHGEPPPPTQTMGTNYFCASSFVTCVGGTQFNDTANPDSYWGRTNTTNATTTRLSALGYIPEGAWNEPVNSAGALNIYVTGGGMSIRTPTPDWQRGTGVPSARQGRYQPDVAMSASTHDPYMICLASSGGDCVPLPNGSYFFGTSTGTSSAAPSWAGIAALLNHRMSGAQGHLNPRLYQLAAVPANNVFHDVTVASSGVSPCSVATPSLCNNSTPSPTGLTGGLAGFAVGEGFDLATGWGSVNAANLLSQWPSVAASVNYQGLWWAMPGGSESGWGINFAHQGDTIFASWFTYDAAGAGNWMVMTAPKVAPHTYAGTLFTTTGPAFNSAPFNPALVTSTSVGTGVLTFSSVNDGIFSYDIGTTSQQKAITREAFGPMPTCAAATTSLAGATNYTDLWWAGAPESGWGINLTHSGTTIFASWFTYDSARKPMWLVVTATRTANNAYSGTLYRTTGPAFNAVPFNPSNVVATAVGSATFTFANGNSATFAYTVNGISQSKTITRELFGAVGTICQ